MTLCECSNATLAAGVRRAEAQAEAGDRREVASVPPVVTKNAFSEDSFGHTACGALVDPPRVGRAIRGGQGPRPARTSPSGVALSGEAQTR